MIPVRPAARVLLFDRDDRLLLLRCLDEDGLFPDPVEPACIDYWVAPGGAVEEGESLARTALRELAEETGLVEVALGRRVAYREVDLVLGDVLTRCQEHYFVGRTQESAPAIDVSRQHPTELSILRDVRWWTIPDLAATADIVFPPDLAALAGRLVVGHDVVPVVRLPARHPGAGPC